MERTADGHIPVLENILAKNAAASAPPPPKTSTARSIDLTPPIKIDAFRLSHIWKAHVIDHSVSPAFDSTLTMNLRVSDVQSTVRPISFAIDLWNDPGLDLLRFEGQGRAAGEESRCRHSVDTSTRAAAR